MICKLRPFIRVLFHFVDGFLCCIDAFWYYFTSASAVHELTISRCITWVSKRKRNQRLNCQHFVGSNKKHYTKPFASVDHNKLWKILKEIGVPDHLTCLLRNLYVQLPVCSSMSNQTWNNELAPNWERSTSRLYIVTLFI